MCSLLQGFKERFGWIFAANLRDLKHCSSARLSRPYDVGIGQHGDYPVSVGLGAFAESAIKRVHYISALHSKADLNANVADLLSVQVLNKVAGQHYAIGCCQQKRRTGNQKHSHEILTFGLDHNAQSVASLMARGHANSPHAPRVTQREVA